MTSLKTKKPVSIDRINSWRMHRQYLDKPYPEKSVLDLLKSTGWLYSPGCSTPYLALWARMSSFKSADLNKLVFEDQKLVQLETLRGCTMLVPRDQAVVAMRVRSRTFTELTKQARQYMPFTESEMDSLKGAVVKTLQSSSKTMEQILSSVPAELVRNFGPDLKRIGITNSLSLAVNLLKEEGKILKVQTRKKLDSTDYSFVLMSNLLPEVDLFGIKFDEACRRLAAQYFKAEAPARIRDFAWWAGINVTDAMRAAAEAKPKLVPIAVEGTRDEYLMAEADADRFHSFDAHSESVNFIPYRDTFLKGQREIVDRFVPVKHADKPFSRWKGKLINDPLATIVRDGQVIGVWEWNENRNQVEHLLFDTAAAKSVERTVRKRADELAAFIRTNLGELRPHSLDYGPHQMTCIHDLKAFWGKGAQVDIRV
jgi:DNA glycosylase AlkZ-like